MTASVERNVEIIDEVMGLMLQIKGAWDQIPADARQEAHEVLSKLHAEEDAAHEQEVQRIASSACYERGIETATNTTQHF